MLLLKKPIRSFAIAVVALSPLVVNLGEAHGAPPAKPGPAAKPAAAPPPALTPPQATSSGATAPNAPAPTPAPAAAAPSAGQPAATAPPQGAAPQTVSPAIANNAPVGPRPVADNEIQKYIRGFRVRMVTDEEGTHLRVVGFGEPSCLRHIKFEFDRPIDNAGGVYGIRISRRDLLSEGRVLRTEDDCSQERTNRCTRYAESGCVMIQDNKIAADLGLASVQGTQLTQDAKVKICAENASDPDPLAPPVCRDVSTAMGGPLEYKTPETIAADLDKKVREERTQLIKATCDAAMQGVRSAYEDLRQQLGANASPRHEKLLEYIGRKVDDNDFKELEKAVNTAKDSVTAIADFNRLIDDAKEFATSHPKKKADVVRLLVEGIAKQALEIEGNESSPAFGSAKMKLVERALKVAYELDRRNGNMRRAYMLAKLERFKYLANLGDDRFYNQSTSKEAFSAFKDVSNWASRSQDPEVSGLQREYAKTFSDSQVPIAYNTPYGPQVVGYLPGNGLDATFAYSAIKNEFEVFRRQGMGMSNGVGTSASSPPQSLKGNW